VHYSPLHSNIQSQNTRAAINHVIQASGAQLTKGLQCAIWELQPYGINDWVVQPMNIHDEIMVPTHPDYVKKVTNVVEKYVEDNKKTIPLLEIDWKENMSSWAEK
jgi:DNA polymerase I-like protein with 3'-5' exonuclease and polymerase domains